MQKYSKLSDEIIVKKLRASVNARMSKEVNNDVSALFDVFDRSKAEFMLETLDSLNKEFKRLDLEKKKLEDAEAASRVVPEEVFVNPKKEFVKIIDDNDFKYLKNSFGIFQLNEEGEQIYTSLQEQFKVTLSKFPNLKMYRAEFYDHPEYNPDREFIHVNLNTGLVSQLEENSEYFFCCFRLMVNPFSNRCCYNSLWIVNSSDSLNDILESDYSSFTFTEVKEEDIDSFTEDFKKSISEAVLSEKYLR